MIEERKQNLYQPSPELIKKFAYEMQLYKAAIKEIKTKLEILDEDFHVRYDYNPIHHIESRLKSLESISGKLKKHGLDLTIENIRSNLRDVAGLRVICNYLHDVNRIADMLIGQDDIVLLEKKDYINNPKPNGYRSLHIIIAVPIFLSGETISVCCKIQIRTIAMDLWASLEHHLRYKALENTSAQLSDRLFKCAEELSSIDKELQSIYSEIHPLAPEIYNYDSDY